MKLSRHTLRRKALRFFTLTPAGETILLAVLVGVLGGFGAILFKKLILFLQALFWSTPDMSCESLFSVSWLKRLVTPAIGGIIVGPMIYFFAREAKGHGVPEVIAAVITRNSIIRPIVVFVKTLASAVSISSGGSVGREGPIVQIGAALASSIGQFFRVTPIQLKTLVGCGVAAGIGATFNAPIAGTLFALELIVSDFGLTAFTPIIVSAVSATAIAHHFHGNVIEFVLPPFQMVSLWEFGLYLLLGVIAGFFGFLFSKSLYSIEDLFEKIKLPPWIRPALGGILVGGVAILFPHIMGVGYDNIRLMFDGQFTIKIMILLAVLKIITTGVTIGSGGSGGIFAPSLFIGAMLGGAYGYVVNIFFPHMSGPFGAYALVGMAAVNGACTLAPLSAIIILIELTNNYGIIIPLMFTVVASTFISRKCSSLSIYTRKLIRRGIQVHQGEDLNILRAISVKDVLRHDESKIVDDCSMEDLLSLALKKHRNVIFTIDKESKFTGMVSLHDIKHILSDPDSLKEQVKMADLRQTMIPVKITQNLDAVINLFAKTGFDRLPVVNDSGVLVGSLIMSDIIRQYNLEVANRNIAIELGAQIQTLDESKRLYLGGTTTIVEELVPRWIVGKSIGELELRKRYDVSVLIVKEKQQGKEPRLVTPGGTYVFREGDTLLLGGKEEHIEQFLLS